MWFQSWISSIITPVTWSFRNHSDIRISCSKTFIISIMLKTAYFENRVKLLSGFFEYKVQKNIIYLK